MKTRATQRVARFSNNTSGSPKDFLCSAMPHANNEWTYLQPPRGISLPHKLRDLQTSRSPGLSCLECGEDGARPGHLCCEGHDLRRELFAQPHERLEDGGKQKNRHCC